MPGNPYHRGKGETGGRFTTPAEAGAQGATRQKPMSEKAQRAQTAYQAHHVVDAEHQRYAEANEAAVAAAIGGKSLDDNEPVDVIVAGIEGRMNGIELKTMLANTNAKITMRADALARKRAWARQNNGTMHTVVIDDSNVFNAKGAGQHDESQRVIYYRRGVGSFRVGSMYQVKDYGELKTLLDTPTRKLPDGAW